MKKSFFTFIFLLVVYNYITAQTNSLSSINYCDNLIANNDVTVEVSNSNTSNFSAYAPPDVWSSWSNVASHTGSVGYSIRAWQETGKGGTSLYCQVRFYNSDGKQVIYDFDDDWFSFRTGNYVANVEVRFKAIPTGCNVKGQIQ